MKKRKKPETDAPPIGERLLTLREAADVLRLSTRTLREYLQRGGDKPYDAMPFVLFFLLIVFANEVIKVSRLSDASDHRE